MPTQPKVTKTDVSSTTKRPSDRTKTAQKSAIPAGAKRPQDHQTAKQEHDGPNDVVVEWDGHEYLVSGEDMDDAELLEFFTDGNFVGALRILLGDEQWAEYKERARNERGKVSATRCSEFLDHALKEIKKGNS